MAVRFLRYINYLVKLGGFCQKILTQQCFWGQFQRKIGWFKILEIAVSPACPAKASGDGGSNVVNPELAEGSKGSLNTYKAGGKD